MRVLASFFVTLLTIVFLFALTGFQVTSEPAATRLLGRLGASMIEIDRWLPAHVEELQVRAEDRPSGTVHPSDLPIAAQIPSAEIQGASADQLRVRVIDAMGVALYNNGTAALRNDQGEVDLAVEEPVRWTVKLLQRSMHDYWLPPLAFSAIVVIGLCLDFLRVGKSPLASILVGACMASLFAGASWMLAMLAGRALESSVDREIMLIARDGAFMGLRNSVTLCAATTALMLVTKITVSQPRQRREARYYYEDEHEEESTFAG